MKRILNWLSRIGILHRSSWVGLDKICHTTYRLDLFGKTIISWKCNQKAIASDWN